MYVIARLNVAGRAFLASIYVISAIKVARRR
jgi:hypothetical protein